MQIVLLGMGPVGLSTAWDLLRRGHTVLGFDKNPKVVQDLLEGKFFKVDSLGEDLRAHLGTRFKVASVPDKLPEFEKIVICVGTPNSDQGSFDLSGLHEALFVFLKDSPQHFIVRSTFLPGTIEQEILPLLKENTLFSYYPEFLREKFAKDDILNPPLAVAAHGSEAAKREFINMFPSVSYHGEKNFSELEILKLACNSFHALKVAFANEISQVSSSVGADPNKVMDMFCLDKKLNLSELYLKPGAPFGGACLDKDLIALESFIKGNSLNGEILLSIRRSNNLQKVGSNAFSFCPPHEE